MRSMPIPPPTDSAALLAKHRLFANIDPADLNALAGRATIRLFRADELIFQKGDPGNGIMAVLSGCVRICCFSEDGNEVVLGIMRPGELFGEIGLIDGGERTAHAYACETTKVLILHRRDVMPFLERNPRACLELLDIAAQRLRTSSVRFEDFFFLDVRTRLAKLLLSLAKRNDKTASNEGAPNIRISQQEIASMIGTSRQAVNKQLREWENSGMIQLHRRSITVRNLENFEDIV
jgi:CRP/FNR family transcriptional regulator, cyclic AMP receptor protein